MFRLSRFFPVFFALPVWGQVTGPQVEGSQVVVPEPDLHIRCDQPLPAPEAPERYAMSYSYESLTLREVIVDSICPGDYTLLREWGKTGYGGSFQVQARQRIDVKPIPTHAMISGPQVIEVDNPWEMNWLDNPTVEIHTCGDYELQASYSGDLMWSSGWGQLCGSELVWTLTDACGNQAEFVQIVIPTECDFPMIAIEMDLVCTDPLACNYTGPWLTVDEEICEYPASPEENCFENSFICNGQSAFVGISVPIDLEPPVIWGVPEASVETISSAGAANWPIGAFDNSGLPVLLEFHRSALSADDCGRKVEEVRIRTEDVCGNWTDTTFTHQVEADPAVPFSSTAIYDPTSISQSEFESTTWSPVNELDPSLFRSLVNLGIDDFEGGTVISIANHAFTIMEFRDQCTHRDLVGIEDFIIYDDVPPPLEMPADLTLACPPSSVSDPVLGIPISAEGVWSPFDGVVISILLGYDVELSMDTLEYNGPGDMVLERFATTQDEAGNVATATQLITVHDTIAPVVPNEIWTFENESDLDVILYAFEAEDNCDGTLMCEVTSWESVEGSCDIIHYLSATDSAGNTGTGSVRFTFANCCNLPTDMNDDGIVGSSDLLLLLATFGSTCQ